MELLLATAERLSEEDEGKKDINDTAMDFGFLIGIGLRKGTRGKQRRRVALAERQLLHLREAACMDEEHMVAEALFDLANMGHANGYARGHEPQNGYYGGMDDDGYAYEDGMEEEDVQDDIEEDTTGRGRHPADGKRHRSWHTTPQQQQQHEPAEWRVGSGGGARRYSHSSHSPEPEHMDQHHGGGYRGHSTRGRHSAGRRTAHAAGGPPGDLSRPSNTHPSKHDGRMHHKPPGYINHDSRFKPGQQQGRKGDMEHADVQQRRDAAKPGGPGPKAWPGAKGGMPDGAAGLPPGFPFLNGPPGMAGMPKIVTATLPNGLQMPMLVGPEGQMVPMPGWPLIPPGLLMHPGVAMGTPQAGPPGQVIGRPAGPAAGQHDVDKSRSNPQQAAAQSASSPPANPPANQSGAQQAGATNGAQSQATIGVPLRAFAQGLVNLQGMGGQQHAALPSTGLPGRRKGCLSHVHIAHFIMQRQQAERQQQAQQQAADGAGGGPQEQGSPQQPGQGEQEGTGRSSTTPTNSHSAPGQDGDQSSSEQQQGDTQASASSDSQGAKGGDADVKPPVLPPSTQPTHPPPSQQVPKTGTGPPAAAQGTPASSLQGDGGPAAGAPVPPGLIAGLPIGGFNTLLKMPPLPGVAPGQRPNGLFDVMPAALLAAMRDQMPPALAGMFDRAHLAEMLERAYASGAANGWQGPPINIPAAQLQAQLQAAAQRAGAGAGPGGLPAFFTRPPAVAPGNGMGPGVSLVMVPPGVQGPLGMVRPQLPADMLAAAGVPLGVAAGLVAGAGPAQMVAAAGVRPRAVEGPDAGAAAVKEGSDGK